MSLVDDDRRAALRAKVMEEVGELELAHGHQVLEEAADVLEVLRALVSAEGYQWSEVENAAERKAIDRGGFTQGIYLIDPGSSADDRSEESQ